MDNTTLFLFTVTVLPLVCTPGPDLFYVGAQAMSGGVRAGLLATTGIVLGYGVHSGLVALGLAAVIAASPLLFETIRWAGFAYLLYLAYGLLRAALRPGALRREPERRTGKFLRGFYTSLLNPKGMMVYIAILPQFMDPARGSMALQAGVLSLAFMLCCALVYGGVTLALAGVGAGGLSDRGRRMVDGGAGAMIVVAAGFVAMAHR